MERGGLARVERSMVYRDRLVGFWRAFKEDRFGIVGIALLVIFGFIAVFGPLLASYDPTEPGRRLQDLMAPPSGQHLLGTDNLGRDLLSRVLYGARVSMIVGITAAAISIILGTLIGVVSGYYGGIFGELLMRFTDVFLVLPFIPLVIILAALFGRSLLNIIVVLGVTSWPATARIIRSEALSLKERPFVERARAIGSGDLHIIRHHILPNVMPLAMANAILTISVAILSESTLSFIGLGDPTMISWGNILSAAYSSNAMTVGAWWFVIPPGLAIALLALGFAFLGHALDEVMNPKLRRQ